MSIKELEAKYPQVCEYCKKEFKSKRPHKRFCSNKCETLNWRKNNPEKMAIWKQRARRKWRKNNIEKTRVHTATQQKISLKGKCCDICGSTENLNRHHQDYSQPLEVIILCARCHTIIHKLANSVAEKALAEMTQLANVKHNEMLRLTKVNVDYQKSLEQKTAELKKRTKERNEQEEQANDIGNVLEAVKELLTETGRELEGLRSKIEAYRKWLGGKRSLLFPEFWQKFVEVFGEAEEKGDKKE